MDNELLLASLVVFLSAYVIVKKRSNETITRRYKTRPINRRRKHDNFYNYFRQMKRQDEEQFFKYTRMTVPVFEEVVAALKERISRRKIKDGIGAEERLALTLHYLSQGGTMQTIAWTYHMGLTTVHQIIHDTCTAISDILAPVYVKHPNTEVEWKAIATDFLNLWNFPHCLGALDGKHISIQAPPKSGSMFFNYKKFFSIVLLAACDAKYRFTMVDIGAYGSQSDGGIFRNSIFGTKMERGELNIPPPTRIPGTDIRMPYVLVADEAFPLKEYIMRPYPGQHLTFNQRVFNYRLSRARRTIENAFGIMVARWRLLKQSINANVENVDVIVKAIVVLHNLCIRKGLGSSPASTYCPPGYADTDDQDNGLWRQDVNNEPLRSAGRLAANHARRICYQIRETITQYFVSMEGAVPWQRDYVLRGRQPRQ